MTLAPDGSVLSVSVSEPRFNRQEVAVLLASRRTEAAARGGHGRLLSESTDPANQFKFRVPEPITDHAEVALTAAKQRWAKENPNTDPGTRLWRVEKLP